MNLIEQCMMVDQDGEATISVNGEPHVQEYESIRAVLYSHGYSLTYTAALSNNEWQHIDTWTNLNGQEAQYLVRAAHG